MECQQPPEEGNSAKEAEAKEPWKGLEENWSFIPCYSTVVMREGIQKAGAALFTHTRTMEATQSYYSHALTHVPLYLLMQTDKDMKMWVRCCKSGKSPAPARAPDTEWHEEVSMQFLGRMLIVPTVS